MGAEQGNRGTKRGCLPVVPLQATNRNLAGCQLSPLPGPGGWGTVAALCYCSPPLGTSGTPFPRAMRLKPCMSLRYCLTVSVIWELGIWNVRNVLVSTPTWQLSQSQHWSGERLFPSSRVGNLALLEGLYCPWPERSHPGLRADEEVVPPQAWAGARGMVGAPGRVESQSRH